MQETLIQIADAIRKRNDPEITEVATFGGDANGLPGVRVEFTDGCKCFLVATVEQRSHPAEGDQQ